MSRDTLLVVDANLPKPLAGSLKKRARSAVTAAELGLSDNVKDPDLLRGLAELYNGTQEWVLVTGDDAMPAEHRQVIIDTQATIATIFPEYAEGVTEHQWNIDIVQRWAHAMQEQKPCTIRRYGIASSAPWRPRRRHIRTIAKEGLTPWRPEDIETADPSAGTKPRGHQVMRLPGIG